MSKILSLFKRTVSVNLILMTVFIFTVFFYFSAFAEVTEDVNLENVEYVDPAYNPEADDPAVPQIMPTPVEADMLKSTDTPKPKAITSRIDRIDASKYPVIEIYVSLWGGDVNNLCNLPQGNFGVVDNGYVQSVQVINGSRISTSFAIILDSSGSMSNIFSTVQQAAVAFINKLSEDNDPNYPGMSIDRACFIDFDGPSNTSATCTKNIPPYGNVDWKGVHPFYNPPSPGAVPPAAGNCSNYASTCDGGTTWWNYWSSYPMTNAKGGKNALVRACNNSCAGGNTAMYEAIIKGIQLELNKASETGRRKIVVVLTDGASNRGASLQNAISSALGSTVSVWPIGLRGTGLDPTTEANMQQLAQATGGEYHFAENAGQVAQVYDTIRNKLNCQYKITYVVNPFCAPCGALQRNFTVTINLPDGTTATLPSSYTLPPAGMCPDLQITNISFNPNPVYEGDYVTITATIKSLYNNAGSFNVDYFIGTTKISTTKSVAGLAKDATINVASDPVLASQPGNYNVSVVVTPTGTTQECDQSTNNTSFYPIEVKERPNLKVLSFNLTPTLVTPTQMVTVSNVKIKNESGTPIPPSTTFYVHLLIDGTTTIYTGWSKAGMGAGEEYTFPTSFSSSPTDAYCGNHTLTVKADATNAVIEKNEGDNTLSKNLTVVNNLYLSQSDIQVTLADTTGTISATIHKDGNCTPHPTFDVQFFIDGVLIGTKTVNAMSSSATTVSITTSLPCETNPANKNISVVVDPSNVIYEANEGDNQAVKSTPFYRPPKIIFGTVRNGINNSPVPNTVVNLKMNGSIVQTTTTNASGQYSFSICNYGNYCVSSEANITGVIGTCSIESCAFVNKDTQIDLYFDPKQISGTVMNKITYMPIPNAIVELKKNSIVISTKTADGDGNYSFYVCENGYYCINATAQYYRQLGDTCVSVTDDVDADVFLKPVILGFNPDPRTLTVMVDSSSCAGSVDIWLDGAKYIKGAYIFITYDTTEVRLLDAGLPDDAQKSLWPPNSIESAYYSLKTTGYINEKMIKIYITTKPSFQGTTKSQGSVYTLLFKYMKNYVDDTNGLIFARYDSTFGIWDIYGNKDNKNVVFTEINGNFAIIDTIMGDVSKSTYSPTCVAEPNLIGDKRLAWCDAELFRYNYAEQRVSPVPGSMGWKIANVAGPAVPFDTTKIDQDGTPPWAPYNGMKDGIHYPFQDAAVDTLDWGIFFEQYNYCLMTNPLRRNIGIVNAPASVSMKTRNTGYEMRDGQVPSTKNQEFTIDIPINNIANMMIGHITVKYNPDVLTVVKYEDSKYFGDSGVELIQASFINNDNGNINIDFATLGDVANGSGNLGSLVFKIKDVSETEITISGSIKDYQNNLILSPSYTMKLFEGKNRESEATLSTYTLYQNYPNPFNPETSISYKIPEKTFVTLSIYNTNGQLIRNLVHEKKSPGHYTVKWDGKDMEGKVVASGVYIYSIKAGNFNANKKMVLMK